MFSFDLLTGRTQDVLADKQSVVLSESTARALFGEVHNAVGKFVEVDRGTSFMVSGVFRDVPKNSSMYFEAVFSFEKWKELTPQALNWHHSGPMTFATLRPDASTVQFENKIKDIISKQVDDKHRTLFARRYDEGYLYDNFNEQGVQSGGRIEYVVMFSLLACFILAIACVNFMNLSTARASKRAKEVGIKKAVGAGRLTLISQFMGESLFMSFLSLLVAILLVDLFLPQFNVVTGKRLELDLNLSLVATLVAVTFFTGLISGSYPALYLSAFNPATVLKGKLHSSLSELWIRNGLVVFQFSLSVISIVAVLVVYNQIQYLQHKDIGYDRENMLYFAMKGKTRTNREAFLQEVRGVPGVVGASTISESLVGGGNTGNPEWEGKDPNDRTPFAIRPLNYGMLELLNMHLVEGRYFAREHQDSMNIVVNQAAVQAMGMKDPIGKSIVLGPIKTSIIGVIKDFHYESLHTPVKPMLFILAPDYTEKVMVKIAGGDPGPTIERLQRLHKEFNPEFPFEFRFLDEDYDAQYYAERRVSMLSRCFAGIAIIISCLGLFGLASYTADRRFKEIGIRKALGSTNLGIIYLLSSDFTKVVAMAIVIALPISFLVLRKWLDGFAFKIDLEWWYFIGSGLLALVIAWLTVASQAARAARVNPVNCLRSE
jgi:predicted permease